MHSMQNHWLCLKHACNLSWEAHDCTRVFPSCPRLSDQTRNDAHDCMCAFPFCAKRVSQIHWAGLTVLLLPDALYYAAGESIHSTKDSKALQGHAASEHSSASPLKFWKTKAISHASAQIVRHSNVACAISCSSEVSLMLTYTT